MRVTLRQLSVLSSLCLLGRASSAQAPPPQKHNVIIFVADGLRRGSVNADDMPTFLRVRQTGVDLRNSHSVFPTFTTANASAIATGHGLGDTGDYANTIYPGQRLSAPGSTAGTVAPFLENDQVLAGLNLLFGGNYLHEETLLSVARKAGYAVASVGKVGPTAIQQIESVGWTGVGSPTPALTSHGAVIIDDLTGGAKGLPLPLDVLDAMGKAGLAKAAPPRTNGFAETSQSNNGLSGNAVTPGTLDSNRVQEQWFTDVSTKVLLPGYAAKAQPFVLLFWSRDPDGTQHNEGDSLQKLAPGINGETSRKGLRNADHCLKQLLDWLDAHPAIKANTDVVLTSDHGFATITRREISEAGAMTSAHSAQQKYTPNGKDALEPAGTLPSGFLAVDLAYALKLRLFEPAVTGEDAKPYSEVLTDATPAHYMSGGSALLSKGAPRADGSNAEVIVAANGGADLLYVPGGDAATVRATLAALAKLDYVGGLFVDDKYCPAPGACPGALRLSDVGLVGASPVPRPAIVVTYKVFYGKPGDLSSAALISDTSLQEGQGMHGGFGREQTWNNMAAMGPDFKRGFVDETALGNIDIVPTLAAVMGLKMPANGSLRGRELREAMAAGGDAPPTLRRLNRSVPTEDGRVTALEYEVVDGVTYYDHATFVKEPRSLAR